MTQPDITLVCDSSKITRRACEGTPDLIIEILSPATFKRDLNDKYDLYESEGVREYWVVSPGDGSVVVYVLDENGQFQEAGIYGKTDLLPVRVLSGFSIDLKRVFR